MLTDRWMLSPEIAKMLDVSEATLVTLKKFRGLPIRRVTRQSAPGLLHSELIDWLKTYNPVKP